MFAEGIRRYCYSLLRRERGVRLDWSDHSLVLRIGDQQATWRLSNRAWRLSCTCGYVNDRCVHLYAAARLFLEILKREQWLHVGAPPARERRRARGPAAPPTDAALSQLELFGATTNLAGGGTRRIEAEADFQHTPGQVTLRFYLNEDDKRRLLRLQQLLNLGLQARHSSGAEELWSPEDGRFLSWLAPQMRKNRAVRQNLQVLKLPRDRFDYWLEYWADHPGRFIERSSQEFLSTAKQSAKMVVELSEQDDWVRIAALVVTPGGRRHHVHEVFKLLASGQGDVVLDGQMLEFVSPLSWELIGEIFSRKSPRMRREHVCEHLPHLLEGRLDIVEGPCVRRVSKPGQVRLHAAAEGADIRLRARVGDGVIRLDSGAPAGSLHDDGRHFVLTTYEAPSALAVRRFLRELEGEVEPDGSVRAAGAPDRIARLVSGWQDLPEDVTKTFDQQLETLLGDSQELGIEVALRERANFVDFHACWACGDVRVADSDLQDALRRKLDVLRTRSGAWLRLDHEKASKLRQELVEAGFSGDGSQRLFAPEAREIASRMVKQPDWVVASHSQDAAQRLLKAPPPDLYKLPVRLHETLRSYQKQGFDFLGDRCSHRVGAILADDMGLGKTLQALALLVSHFARHPRASRRGKGEPGALVICPASVVAVWLEEAEKFCADLRCAAYAGPADGRAEVLRGRDWDVLVTNYALARIDAEALTAEEFSFVILDEAQQIKNPDSQIAQVVKRLRTPRALALTGTPLENRLLDLWSIMDFVNPGFLGERDHFLTRHEGGGSRTELPRRIAPVILRRTKEAVAPELPPRTEEVLKIELFEEQRRIYDAELLRARSLVLQKGPIEVLAALTRLRQVCCHPQLLIKKPTEAGSAKLDTLLELVAEVVDEGHSALVFSQFTSMLSLIEAAIADVPTFTITGRTPTAKRAELVRRFNQSRESQVFLLSLRAAGTGITLTKADYVFIFDPWWNPAVERQAIDRTHRIGQDKPVFAYRLAAADTIEEKVLALQQEKAELFAEVMQDAEQAPAPQRLSAADIQMLLS